MPRDEWRRANQKQKYGSGAFARQKAYEEATEKAILLRAVKEAAVAKRKKRRAKKTARKESQTPVRKAPAFLVPAGTICRVSKVMPLEWREHVARKDLEFSKYESYRHGVYTFQFGDWFLDVLECDVLLP